MKGLGRGRGGRPGGPAHQLVAAIPAYQAHVDKIEPEIGPEQSKFADVTGVIARLQQQYDLDLSPRRQPEDAEAAKRGERTSNPHETCRREQRGASWCTS